MVPSPAGFIRIVYDSIMDSTVEWEAGGVGEDVRDRKSQAVAVSPHIEQESGTNVGGWRRRSLRVTRVDHCGSQELITAGHKGKSLRVTRVDRCGSQELITAGHKGKDHYVSQGRSLRSQEWVTLNTRKGSLCVLEADHYVHKSGLLLIPGVDHCVSQELITAGHKIISLRVTKVDHCWSQEWITRVTRIDHCGSQEMITMGPGSRLLRSQELTTAGHKI
ncbi:hypothetical protein RRG08_015979 [Elysia crispata]|uniref:Uncharacterized protein n=1 Tax=Elysia crispata TaxID=231223 RepID=A0AAE1CXF4_9GAST|nr:hypothetical protein RRG08_015979 [Elysia crispata]